jgi:hypothetical protein
VGWRLRQHPLTRVRSRSGNRYEAAAAFRGSWKVTHRRLRESPLGPRYVMGGGDVGGPVEPDELGDAGERGPGEWESGDPGEPGEEEFGEPA